MKNLVDFYNGLDALNLIIFWGIVIVVILIIVFAILLLCKKKKGNEESIEESKEEKTEEIIPTLDELKEEPVINEEVPKEEPEESKEIPHEPTSPIIEEEKNFVAEEHVIEYNNDLFNIPNLKKNNPEEIKAEKQEPDIFIRREPFDMPKKPYEKNVLRQMSLSQTSPIGLTIPKNEEPKEELPPLVEKLSDELQENKYLIQEDDEEIPVISQDIVNEINKEESDEKTEEIVMPEEEQEEKMFDLPIIEHFENTEEDFEEQPEIIPEEEPVKEKESNEQYLEEVSRKLSEAEIPEEIQRTDYEKKQEEDAIISYKELMEKKDSIETVDEEDAVISIDELMQRKQEEKLYNLTENEKTDDFINELKKFRNDL